MEPTVKRSHAIVYAIAAFFTGVLSPELASKVISVVSAFAHTV